MKNKDLRKKVLKEGTYKDYSKKRRIRAKNGVLEDFESEELYNPISEDGTTSRNEEKWECERIRKCRIKQTQKVKEHIDYLFTEDKRLFFRTFTIADKFMNNKESTKRERVSRLLNRTTADYILNVDYGDETDRQHYHAVIQLDNDKCHDYKTEVTSRKGKKREVTLITELDGYEQGYYNVEEIDRNDKSAEKLAKYQSKLTLHSVKVEQKYISVKKGSSYQLHKKEERRTKFLRRNKAL